MTPTEARQLWAETLRSGEFKQGYSQLHDPENNSYCCLGVACELYQRHVGDLAITQSSAGMKFYDGAFTVLPDKVACWLNVHSGGLCLWAGCLVAMNDIARLSFGQIADFIEQDQLKPYEGPCAATT